MSAFRPLPPNPSLEFEHKEAKTLLKRLRAGEHDALERVRAQKPAINPAASKLADAQFVIAREYGFASWPKLVSYFHDLDRLRGSVPGSMHRSDFYEQRARALMRDHKSRIGLAAHALAAYVPRFYGMPVDDIFAATITEDEARLAVARWNKSPSWEVLLERAEAAQTREPSEWEVHPLQRASLAIKAADLDALKRVVDTYPELLHPSDNQVAMGGTLIRTALHHERRQGAAIRPIIDWLEQQGFDVQQELNRQLCGHMRMKIEKVRWLLERGADPNWIAPNGIPVLEHALIRYWNGEAVDLVAERAVPRESLWIAAGLGDVKRVARFLDRNGKPTATARRYVPDFVAVAPGGMLPVHPHPDDEVVLMEAFVVAVLNNRTAVMEYMVERGFPVDTLVWGMPVVSIAAGNALIPQLESLVRCGANLDLKGDHPHQSAREHAREMLEMLNDPERRRVAELCGLDPDAILAEHNARPLPEPSMAPKLRQALALAADDALRLGQSAVEPENLLFGLLRPGGLPVLFVTKFSRIDVDRFRADVEERIRPGHNRVTGSPPPMHGEAQRLIDAAISLAAGRRQEVVTEAHLLYALLQEPESGVATLLERYGASIAELIRHLESAL